MNNDDYPNRDALRKANDIYLDVMRSFITHNLRQVTGENVEHLIEDVLYENQIDHFHQMLDEHNDIGLAIDFTYIPHIIKEYWEDIFAVRFQQDLVTQNMLWIIRKGRNKCEHRGNDLDIEFVQTHLFLISDILKIINRSDKHDEVVNIRNELISTDTKKKITELSDQIEKIEAERKEYKGQYLETNKLLEEIKKVQLIDKERIDELLLIKKEKEKIEKDKTKLSKELKETEDAWNSTEMSLKSKEKQLKDEIEEHNSSKEQISSLTAQIEAAELENNRYKTKLEDEKRTNKIQLESIRDKCEEFEKETEDYRTRLNVIQKHLHTTSLPVYPSNNIDTSVRILDRRNTNRRSYLTKLLELNQPAIICVDSEEKTEIFFKHIAGDKEDSIGRHNDYSSESEEKALLEKLAKGDLIAIVSNATLASIPDNHVIEHIIFCQPILDLDEFSKQCQPAFTTDQNVYLHLIYDTTQEFEVFNKELNEKYPDQTKLKELYKALRSQENSENASVNLEILYEDLNMEKTGIDTGIAIFVELGFIERSGQEIKLLETNKKQLDDSKKYTEGINLKEKADSDSYQLGMDTVENIWEKILHTLDIETKHIIHEQPEDTYRTNNGSQHETENDKNDRPDTDKVDTPQHSRAKVNAEQVKDIRERAADGETLSNLSREYGMSSTGIWNIVNKNTWKDIE